ncbi:MAG TPA: MoxR family ATPase [Nitrososphaerales archaeon]|nr:MoxR family ATPase [Nitrososphaerales archaeon]
MSQDSSSPSSVFASMGKVELERIFEKELYVADQDIITAVYLAIKLDKPLLIEGDPGCGKTEIAKALSEGLGTTLIRLQCYEGLDANSTIYEWDYVRQLLEIKIEEGKKSEKELKKSIFGEEFLLKRPLLQALMHNGPKPPVLIIDEIDRADEEFEGILLEFLGEFQVSIPEIGTIRAQHKPIVILTSNRTRELGDGLRRRCLYLYLSQPSAEKELMIVKLKVPGIQEKLATQVVQTMSKIRSVEGLVRKPGISETLDWANALVVLNMKELDAPTAIQTINCVLKNPDELEVLNHSRIEEIVSQLS